MISFFSDGLAYWSYQILNLTIGKCLAYSYLMETYELVLPYEMLFVVLELYCQMLVFYFFVMEEWISRFLLQIREPLRRSNLILLYQCSQGSLVGCFRNSLPSFILFLILWVLPIVFGKTSVVQRAQTKICSRSCKMWELTWLRSKILSLYFLNFFWVTIRYSSTSLAEAEDGQVPIFRLSIEAASSILICKIICKRFSNKLNRKIYFITLLRLLSTRWLRYSIWSGMISLQLCPTHSPTWDGKRNFSTWPW